MRSKIINLRVSPELLKKIDEAAKASYKSRNSYIRESIVLRLNEQHIVRNQAEEEKWQALIDASLNLPPEIS